MSSFVLKILGIILMAIDHVGLMFFPTEYTFRALGRIAFPIFAFQTTQGFKYSKNKEKYILRLLLFTVISQLPYWFFLKTAIPENSFMLNVGATLTLGSLCLYILEKKSHLTLKLLLVPITISLARFIPMDYGWIGVSIIVLFYLLERRPIFLSFGFVSMIIIYCLAHTSPFELPAILALLPILMYDGKQGPKAKYLFYSFYPLHFLILFGIKLLIT